MPHEDIYNLWNDVTDNISHFSKVTTCRVDAISKLTKESNTIGRKFGQDRK